MTPTLPDKDKGTCLLASIETSLGIEVHLHNLGKRSGLLAKTLSLHLPGDEAEATQAAAVLKYLGGRQIIHFNEQGAVKRLQDVVVSAGFKPIDNEIHDIRPLAKAFCRVENLPDEPSLDDFAELRGYIKDDRIAAQLCPVAKSRLLHDVWTGFVLSPLSYSRSLDAHAVPAPRSIREIDMSLHGLPLPAPTIPDVPTPKTGWRRTFWGQEEAQDCAFRFVEGASLEGLSSLFRRSPRAIHSRLVLDGILEK